MAKVVSPGTYAKNVLKSSKYIAIETIKGINPSLTDFIKDTSSTVKDMYTDVRSFKQTINNKLTTQIGSSGVEYIKETGRDAWDDLRTGKFYNRERQNAAMDAYMKAQGLDFDFDLDDLNNDDNISSKDGSDNGVSEKTITTIGDKIAFTQQKASQLSADSIIRNARSNTKASMHQNDYSFRKINNSLAIVNSSILSLHQDLATPLNTHIINSTNFYSSATEQLAKQTAYLENMNKIFTDKFAPVNNKNFGKKKTSEWNSVMGEDLPDFAALRDIVKKRISSGTGLDTISSFLDPEMFKMIKDSGAFASPIALLMTTYLSGRIRKGPTGKALDRTIDTLRGGFADTAIKISNYARSSGGNSALKALAKLFDIIPDSRSRIDFSQYNKGRADWTGKDSKALQEVIPNQLSQIIAALTGKEGKVFDYESGTWKSVSSIKKDFNRRREIFHGSSTRFLRNDILDDFIREDRENNPNSQYRLNRNSRAVRNLSRDYDRLISLMTMNRMDMSHFRNANDFVNAVKYKGWTGSNGGPILVPEASVRRIAKSIYKRSGASGDLSRVFVNSRAADSRFIRNEGNNSLFAQISNGSGLQNFNPDTAIGVANRMTNTIINNSIDNKGHNIFFYLQDYYTMLRKIAADRVSGTAHRRNRNNRRIGAPNSFEVPLEEEFVSLNERISSINNRVLFSEMDEGNPYDKYNSRTGLYEEAEPRTTTRATIEHAEKSSKVSKIIDKINEGLNKIFYGDAGTAIKEKIEKEGGVLGAIKSIPKSISELSNKLVDKLKEKWEKFKESEFGQDFIGASKDYVKSGIKSVWTHAKIRAGQGYEYFFNREAPWMASIQPTDTTSVVEESTTGDADPTGAYKGGYVRKSGMASVSEGEYIVPAKYNPMYKGNMSDGTRSFIENNNYSKWLRSGGDKSNFYGFFAKGGRVNAIPKGKKKKIQELWKKGYTTEDIAREVELEIPRVKYYITESRIDEKFKDIRDAALNAKNKASTIGQKITQSETYKKAKDFAGQRLISVDNALEKLFGNPEKYKDTKTVTKDAMKVAKDNLPKTMAGGALGALVGAAVTGSGLGLMGGFAIGAGVSILKNSEDISKRLFGEFDEKGEQTQKGLLPTKVSKFIKNRLPNIAKGGALGAILGTIGLAPGGIFGGLVLGAGLELVSTTDTFKNIMFGHEGVDGKRRGGIMGALKANVVDPLANFVKEGTGKIQDYVKNKILSPVSRLFDPLKDWIRGRAIKTLDSFTSKVKEKVTRTIGEKFGAVSNLASKTIGFAGKKLIGAAGSVISSPFQLAGKAGDKLKLHNIKKGYSSLTADERVKAMQNAGKQAGKYNLWAQNASDEDILLASKYMSGANSFKRTMMKERQQLANAITGSLEFGGQNNPKLVKEIKGLFNTNDVIKNDDLSAILNRVDTLDIGENQKELLRKKIIETQESLKKNRSNMTNFNENRAAWMASVGFTKKDMKKSKIQSILDSKRITGKSLKDLDASILAAKEKDDAKKILAQQDRDNPQGAKTNSILSNILSTIQKMFGIINTDDNGNPRITETSADQQDSSDAGVTDNGSPINNTVTRITNGKNPNEPKDGDRKTINDDKGNPVEWVYKNGEWRKDTNDADTREQDIRERENDSLRNKFFKMFVNGGLLASLKGLLNPENNEDSNKNSIWSKIKDFFTGEKSIFTKIGRSLGVGSGGIGGILTKAGTVLLKSLPGILGTLATIWGVNKYADSTAGGDYDPNMYNGADSEDVKESYEDEGVLTKFKRGLDTIQNRIMGRKTTTYDQDDYQSAYITDNADKRAILNIAMSGNKTLAEKGAKNIAKTVGRVPIIGKTFAAPLKATTGVISKTGEALGKAGSKISYKLADIATDPSRSSTSIVTKIATKISPIFDKIAEKLGVNVVGMADEAAEAIARAGGSKIGTILSKASVVTYVASIVYYFTDGLQDAKAKTILGILETPTFMQRILAATLNALNAAIPGIGGIIPTETLFNIFYTILHTTLGIDFGTLADQRENAKQVVEAYNTENGTTYNVEEYIHNVLGEYTVGEKVKKSIKSGISTAKEKISQIPSTIKKVGKKISSTYSTVKSTVSEKVNNAVTGTKKIVKTAGEKLSEVKDNAVDGVKSSIKDAKSNITSAIGFMKAGNLSALWTDKYISKEDDSFGPVVEGVNLMTKMALTIPTAIISIGKKISGIFTSVKSKMPDVTDMLTDLWEYTDSDKHSSMDGFSNVVDRYKNNGDDAFSAIGNNVSSLVGGIMRIVVSIVRPLKTLTNFVSDIWGSFKNTILGDEDTSTSGNSDDGLWGTIKDTGSNIWEGLKNMIFGSGSGSGAHTSQKNNFRKYGNSTIDENGCGPAAASSILKLYGKNIELNDAASYAESGGYVAGSSGMGTRASYFKDILGKNGINTKYTNKKSDIQNAIASGNPAILLGQDSSNRSKITSPYGPNPHYIVARGTDKKGNIIVDDPELNSTTTYNKNILNKTKLGVLTGGDSGVAGITNTVVNSAFTLASEKLGTNSVAGKVLNMFTNGYSSDNSSRLTSGYSYNSGVTSDSGATYFYNNNSNSNNINYGESPVPIMTSLPSKSDKYIYLYNNSNNGGKSRCVNGRPTNSTCNVLSNCVGWACGRFNHIYNLLTGYDGIKYSDFCHDAVTFADTGRKYGLTVDKTPQVGAIMCWSGGNSGCGHVAIVEKVMSPTQVFTSESGYNQKTPLSNRTVNKGDGNWRETWMTSGKYGSYDFLGFIHNPAVEGYEAGTSSRAIDAGKGSGLKKNNATSTNKSAHNIVGRASGITTSRQSNPAQIKTHNFTLPNTSTSRGRESFSYDAYKKYRGGASTISNLSTSASIDSLNNKSFEMMILYLKQIAANTGYNTAIPSIIEILKSTANVLSGVVNGATNGTATSDDAATAMNNEISLMMTKLDTIAQTL